MKGKKGEKYPQDILDTEASSAADLNTSTFHLINLSERGLLLPEKQEN